MHKRIFLIGYMGVGKTTTGRELAKVLGFEFIDLDHYIQDKYQLSISQIFDQCGQEGFRDKENKALIELSNLSNVVISTGGGAPCFHNNMQLINQTGISIYLKTDPVTLSERLNTCKEKRPLIRDKNQEELLQFVTENLKLREPFYNQANIVFETHELIQKDQVDKYVLLLIERLKNYKTNT